MAPRRSKSPSYFKKDTKLTPQEQSYCRCTLHVAAKNSPTCNLSRYKSGSPCYNPYAVCTKVKKRTGSITCGTEYNFRTMPKEERDAFAAMHGIDPRKYKTERGLISALERKSKKESPSTPTTTRRPRSALRSPRKRSPTPKSVRFDTAEIVCEGHVCQRKK